MLHLVLDMWSWDEFPFAYSFLYLVYQWYTYFLRKSPLLHWLSLFLRVLSFQRYCKWNCLLNFLFRLFIVAVFCVNVSFSRCGLSSSWGSKMLGTHIAADPLTGFRVTLEKEHVSGQANCFQCPHDTRRPWDKHSSHNWTLPWFAFEQRC